MWNIYVLITGNSKFYVRKFVVGVVRTGGWVWKTVLFFVLGFYFGFKVIIWDFFLLEGLFRRGLELVESRL